MAPDGSRKTSRRAAAAATLAAGAALTAALAGGGPARAQVYAIALPDPTNKTLIVRPETVPAGGSVEIISAVQNKGAGALTPAHSTASMPPALSIKFLLVANVLDASGTAAGGWGVDRLERREVKRQTVLWTVPPVVPPGSYFLCADVDPGKKVRESNEHNNRTCQPLTVGPPLENMAEGGAPAEDGEALSPPEEAGSAPPASGATGSGDNPPDL